MENKFHTKTITIPRKAYSKISAEEFCDLRSPEDVRIAPNGKNVIYTLATATKKGRLDKSSIWIATIGQEKSAQQLTSGMFHDRHARWSPDGESVAFLSDRAAPGKSCAIYILHVLGAGGEAYPVTPADYQADISAFEWSPDGSSIAYISPDEKTADRKRREDELDDVQVFGTDWSYNRLRILHIGSGTTKTVYSKENHVTRLVWSPDSKELIYLLHDVPTLDSVFRLGAIFELYSIANSQSWHVAHFAGRVLSHLTWTHEGVSFLAGASPEKAFTSRALWTLSVADSSIKRVGFGEESCAESLRQLSNKGGENFVMEQANLVDNIIHQATGRQMYSGRHNISTWDVLASESANSFVLVICKSTVSTPTEVFSLSMANDRRFGEHKRTAGPDDLVQLSNHSAHISSLQLATSQNLRCPSNDGSTQIDGIFVSPASLANDVSALSRPLPTIVWIHGGPYNRVNNRFDADDDNMVPYLVASERYGVLLPNYRGSSARGEAFASHARGKAGTVDYEDIIALVDKAIQRGLVDRERIIVGGWSQGGFLSYMCAVRNGTQNGWRFKGAICGAGISDADTLAATADTYQFADEASGNLPWKSAKDDVGSRQASAIWEMSTAKDLPPVLILHGAEDERVPVSQARMFHKGCSHYSFPCEMAIYPREGHRIRERTHKIDLLKRIRRFCDLHLSI